MKKLKVKVVKSVVSRKGKVVKTVSNAKKTKVLPEQSPMISVGRGLTINMGNYESEKIDVHVSLPCTKADIRHAIDEGFKIVDKALSERIARLNEKEVSEEGVDILT